MLAKVWKKALLAICIVACIYNVMHKLIVRTSLDVQLKSVESKTSVMDSAYEQSSLKIDEEIENEELEEEEDTIVVIN